jgi:hypothetical protein
MVQDVGRMGIGGWKQKALERWRNILGETNTRRGPYSQQRRRRRIQQKHKGLNFLVLVCFETLPNITGKEREISYS